MEDIDPALLLTFIQDYLKEHAEFDKENQEKDAPEEEPAKETIAYTRNKPKRDVSVISILRPIFRILKTDLSPQN